MMMASYTRRRVAGLAKATALLIFAGLLGACSPAAMAAFSDGLSAFSRGYANGARLASAGELLVFGGADHKTFLGCLTCGQYQSGSLLNAYSPHGSQYSAVSIFNKYSEHGSKYSGTSACSSYASNPQVIVDRNGQYYGRLTVNQYHAERANDSKVLAWLMAVCQ